MMSDAARIVAETTAAWLADPQSDVVWAGDYEGRRGIRFRQTVRDFTTMWFEVGQRTVGIEAFLIPAPPFNKADVYEYCLRRSARSWPVHIALDHPGDLVIVGRVPLPSVTAETLDGLLGSVYETVELSFRTLLSIGFGREKSP